MCGAITKINFFGDGVPGRLFRGRPGRFLPISGPYAGSRAQSLKKKSLYKKNIGHQWFFEPKGVHLCNPDLLLRIIIHFTNPAF
jgi:hypothetical protein